jgi:hypothetical protein
MRWHEALARIPAREATSVAEIGVWKGSFCKVLLAARPRLRMVLVDPWQAGVPNTSWYESSSRMPHLPQSEYEAAYQRVLRIAARSDCRAHVLRMASVDAAPRVYDASLHMAFLDGDHSCAGLLADIAAWQPKVRPGGWIGGHDYGAERFPGVAEAVALAFEGQEVTVGADYTWWVQT